LKLFVLVFPLVNVTSTFPMIGVTVGDNLFPIFPLVLKTRFGQGLSRKICRLCVSIPPIVAALVFYRLDDILTVAGLFGFVLVLMVPCAFQYYGRIYCNKHYGKSQTPFTVPFWSDIRTAEIVFWLSFLNKLLRVNAFFGNSLLLILCCYCNEFSNCLFSSQIPRRHYLWEAGYVRDTSSSGYIWVAPSPRHLWAPPVMFYF